MTPQHEATRRQHDAAQPMESTWLSANAGSGKTRVLTDRVARLLLERVEPQHILCLTYTKAAASEMQNRLFKRLGEWAMLDDDKLIPALADLGLDRTATSDDLREARTLFARAIETPGGLKIQTIHSFCASLLRRFPLEAGVSPQFTEIEDRAADLLRAELIDKMASGPEAGRLTDLARQYTGEDFLKLTQEIVRVAQRFQGLTRAQALALFDQPATLDRAMIERATFHAGDAQMLKDLVPLLLAKGGNDAKAGARLATISHLDYTALPILVSVFLFGPTAKAANKAKIGSFPTKQTQNTAAHLMPDLEALMQRVEDARAPMLALNTAERALTLHRFAQHFAQLYTSAKQRRGWLDFDDLIQKARQLLGDNAVAAWVLYRLDGGIDHILVDEAQDTSPAQWDVIRKLAEEFSSGEGARADVTRTIFVVGDKKQSIYSFQGADPREFDRMRAEFGARLTASGQTLHDNTLDYSFRSSPGILRLVDSVFQNAPSAGFGQNRHIAFHSDLPGRVDLWPLVPKPEKEPEQDWFDPVDRRHPEHQHRILAQAIATRVKEMVDTHVIIPDEKGPRPIQPRDILILVQRRSGIFSDIIRACKEVGLPIAGADRLKVGAEIAVKDLGALLSFLATAEDSLSLATALRSPLFGWSEQELFTLANGRAPGAHLWPALRNGGGHSVETVSILRDLRDSVDFLRPYDLIERMLTRYGGRRRLLARLGAEAEDGINAMLSQALAYERSAVPSLTGFLTWMETDDLEVKRQIDSASNQIRVMTVHGSKGLESPVVILPECGKRELRNTDDIIEINGVPVWKVPALQQPHAMAQHPADMKVAQREESLRLLYVALTRAEKWLIVGASGTLDKDGDDWHQRVAAAMAENGAVDLDTPVGTGMRTEYGSWALTATTALQAKAQTPPPLDPMFRSEAPDLPRPLETLSPSDLGGAKALPGDGLDEETAKTYGTLVHRLLELPTDALNMRGQAVSDTADLPSTLAAQALKEAQQIVANPTLTHIFDPATLAEVPVTAHLGARRLHGTIDRLIVTHDTIHIIDFKSNRAIPVDASACPEGVLRQMGAYAHAIGQVYPQHTITLAILWTRTGQLMAIPHEIVTQALMRTQYLDDAHGAT